MINKLFSKPILKQIFLFGMVGGIGFVVDTTVLYLCKMWFGLYGARLISFVAAVWVTWWLNRRITFQKSHYSSAWREFCHYFVCMLGGGTVNLVSYIALVYYSSLIASYPIIAVAIGSLAGMAVNFIASKFFIFRS